MGNQGLAVVDGERRSILEAPKLFLDTCHLINIAKIRSGKGLPASLRIFETAYREIFRAILDRHFGLIFALAAPLEWISGKAVRKSAMEIADVVDSAPLQYEMEGDEFVFLHEILEELRRTRSDLSLPRFEIFFVRKIGSSQRRALSTLINEVQGYFDEGEVPASAYEMPFEIPIWTVREVVEDALKFRNSKPDTFDKRVTGHAAAFNRDLVVFQNRNNRQLNSNDIVNWMKKFVRVDRVILSGNPGEDVDAILRGVDVGNCPAVDLFTRAHIKRLQAGQQPQQSDVGDWTCLPVVPYADLVLSERQLTHFACSAMPALKSKMTHDPRRFAEWLTNWY